MKRRFSARIIALLVMLPVLLCAAAAAHAESLYEWSRACRTKTAYATPVYRRYEDIAAGMPQRTLPEGTYVKIASSVNGIAIIDYMTADGIRGSGYVWRDAITYATVNFIDADGLSHGMQELQYWDMYDTYPPPGCSAMKGFEPEGYRTETSAPPASTPAPAPDDPSDGTPAHTPDNSPASAATTKPSASTSGGSSSQGSDRSGSTASAARSPASAQDEAAFTVVRAGFASCIIRRSGQEQEAATRELVFSSGVPEDKKIAYIYAPNSGQCSLRAKGSENAKSLRQCMAGTVVVVLDYGDEWTKIRYRSDEGYVRTRCLHFSDGKAEPLGTGMLTYNGRATGKTTINIRNAADKDSAKVAEWRTSTTVTVFSLQDGWYEIEYKGVHGYVMEEFLTMAE